MFERAKTINREFTTLNLRDKFIYLMQSQWKILANYMESAWIIRQNELFI